MDIALTINVFKPTKMTIDTFCPPDQDALDILLQNQKQIKETFKERQFKFADEFFSLLELLRGNIRTSDMVNKENAKNLWLTMCKAREDCKKIIDDCIEKLDASFEVLKPYEVTLDAGINDSSKLNDKFSKKISKDINTYMNYYLSAYFLERTICYCFRKFGADNTLLQGIDGYLNYMEAEKKLSHQNNVNNYPCVLTLISNIQSRVFISTLETSKDEEKLHQELADSNWGSSKTND